MNNNKSFLDSLRAFPFKRAGVGIVIILIDIGAIYLIFQYAGQDEKLKNLGYEMIKLSVQLLLIVLFGGIFIQEYNRARAKKTAKNDFRRDILRNLSRAYSDVKGVRRILRAKCHSDLTGKSSPAGDCIPFDAYDEHIATINTTQLELEILARELRVIKEVFEKTDKLIKYIEIMEKYIETVICEYESKSKRYRSTGTVPLAKLPELNAFIAIKTSEKSSFKSLRTAIMTLWLLFRRKESKSRNS